MSKTLSIHTFVDQAGILCIQTSVSLHLSKFHDIQEYRMRLQNNFGHNICFLGFSFIPFLHKNCRTRERYAFASCHNCGFSVCNLIIDFLPAQPGELSEICRKPKLYIPGMYTIKTQMNLVDFW